MTEAVDHVISPNLIDPPELISRIGNTPLFSLPMDRLLPDLDLSVEILAKAEWFNPGGSIKDRAAWSMVRSGLKDGTLKEGDVIIDASSGNTGIALAMVGSALGFTVTICIPKNATPERLRMLEALGANVELTDPLEGMDGAIRRARELVSVDPNMYFYTDQYNNDANWRAHYENTAREIIQQTSGGISHFVAGLGTSGTFTGVARRMREELPHVRMISMQPDSPFHGIEGLKHMESAMIPGIYDDSLADETVTVSTTEAQTMTKTLAKKAGMLVGISSGANVAAAVKVASELDAGQVVTILCDRGERYLSDAFWED